jgi:hypothetical protein
MRRLTTISIAVALVLLALTATAAKTITSSGGGASGEWTWETAIPGDSMAFAAPRVTNSVAAAGRVSSAVSISAAREVAIAAPIVELPGSGMTLVSAPAASGDPCFTFVSDEGATRQFTCIDGASSQDSILRFVGSGGTKIGTPAWVTVVGLVRNDVSRLTVVSNRGKETDLPLNRWRAFQLHATSLEDFPRFLRSYDADGKLIEELATAP